MIFQLKNINGMNKGKIDANWQHHKKKGDDEHLCVDRSSSINSIIIMHTLQFVNKEKLTVVGNDDK